MWNPTAIRRVGTALLLAGIVSLVILFAGQRHDRWVLLTLDVPLDVDGSATASWTAPKDGFVELQLELDTVVSDELLERYITTRKDPSELEVDWTVTRAGARIVGGNCKGYSYIEPPAQDAVRTLYRTLLRSPYGFDTTARNTLGLAGRASAARGVGRFRAEAGTEYLLELTAVASHDAIADGRPRMILRPDRRLWQEHWSNMETLGVFGWFAFDLGAVVLALSFVWRRRPAAT